MLTWKTLTAAGLGLVVLLAGMQLPMLGQQRAPVLTALDQIEIQQLVAQANYALHTGQDEGGKDSSNQAADHTWVDGGNIPSDREAVTDARGCPQS